ncbi:MAG TPA: universal stress protein [Solirubrobacteraceae bacterium]|nr:universal stress protein [Solirubrobacteraceae bacterium]
MTAEAQGPVVFAYDGSDLAKLAIEEAGRLLDTSAGAIVACVWQTFNVGFVSPAGVEFNAAQAGEVKRAAQETAAEGAARAQAAGFAAQAVAIESAPTWKGLSELAEDRDARVVVLGSHGRTGLANVLLGSVATAFSQHSPRSVLIVHRRPQ